MSKGFIIVGFFLAFHAAYAVSKIRNLIYGENNSIDFMKFPFEILIEIVTSFLLVTVGTIKQNIKLDEICIDKQNVERRMKTIPRHIVSSSNTKGGMINYFCKDRIPDKNYF